MDQSYLTEDEFVDLFIFAGFGVFEPRLQGEPYEEDYDSDVYYKNVEEEE